MFSAFSACLFSRYEEFLVVKKDIKEGHAGKMLSKQRKHCGGALDSQKMGGGGGSKGQEGRRSWRGADGCSYCR